MRAMIITDEVQARIKEVMRYAEKHIFSMDDMLDIMNKQREPPGNDPNHVVHIPIGYKVVFTMDNQNIGICKHISISVDRPDKLPNPIVVENILQEFGIWTPLEDLVISFEDLTHGYQAITVVEPPPK
jgi:hypothetical protein